MGKSPISMHIQSSINAAAPLVIADSISNVVCIFANSLVCQILPSWLDESNSKRVAK